MLCKWNSTSCNLLWTGVIHTTLITDKRGTAGWMGVTHTWMTEGGVRLVTHGWQRERGTAGWMEAYIHEWQREGIRAHLSVIHVCGPHSDSHTLIYVTQVVCVCSLHSTSRAHLFFSIIPVLRNFEFICFNKTKNMPMMFRNSLISNKKIYVH